MKFLLVLPVYNAALYINQSVDIVCNFPALNIADFEMIVVDDGCQDQTFQFIASEKVWRDRVYLGTPEE